MYTGTGTEQDPYLVSNLTDLLECIAITNAYVKVIADINAADDENYTGEISAITFSCAKLYADELKIIDGVTVNASIFIYGSSTGHTMQKIFFKNCEHKISIGTSAGSFINGGIRTSNFIVDECKFSVRAVYDTTIPYYFNTQYVAISNSAIDFTSGIGGINTSGSPFIQCSLSYSNLVIRNAVGLQRIATTVTRSAVILENPEITANTISLVSSSSGYSYFAFINPVFTQTDTGINTAGTLTKVLCMIDNPTGTYTISGPTVVTSTQLKDQAYLTEVGFLP